MNLMAKLNTKKKSAKASAQERHSAFIARYLESLAAQPGASAEARHISIIARSPNSPVIAALVSHRENLKQLGISVQAIFSEMKPETALAEFAATLSELRDGDEAHRNLRWARNACLMDAHEQLILGTTLCWSGDCMRREPGKCDSLDLFEVDAAGAVRLGNLAFDAIWSISQTVSASRLHAKVIHRPSGAYAAGHEGRLTAFSFMKKTDSSSPIAH